jgi:hypothetical protein
MSVLGKLNPTLLNRALLSLGWKSDKPFTVAFDSKGYYFTRLIYIFIASKGESLSFN